MWRKRSKYEAGDSVVDQFSGERGVVLISRPADMPECVVVQLNGGGDGYYVSKTQLRPA
jgi:hypothetical protein